MQDLLDSAVEDALTNHQTHQFGPKSHRNQRAEGQRQQQAGRQAKQVADMPGAVQKATKQDVVKCKALPKRPLPGRPKIWMQ